MEGYVKLQASAVPGWTIARAAERMKTMGIPVRQSSLVRAAVAAFIGLDDNQIREVATGNRLNREDTLDEFLASLNQPGEPEDLNWYPDGTEQSEQETAE